MGRTATYRAPGQVDLVVGPRPGPTEFERAETAAETVERYRNLVQWMHAHQPKP
jgi:hypothetical protein